MKLNAILENTVGNGYAVGSFSPRYVNLIQPVLLAAQACASPAIVQISQKEFHLYGVTPAAFAQEYRRQKQDLQITVPTVLHLDHTKELTILQDAIAAGFESVMVDASEKEFEDNVAVSGEVAEYAHSRGVSVEAELGRIGSNDLVETDDDSEFYTKPEEAALFVRRTGVDALAVSVGTAHGVYTVKAPTVEYDIIRRIKALTPVYLVLHGGSGVPADMVIQSYMLEGGGISKVNIATDLELAFLDAMGQKARMTDAWCTALEEKQLEIGRLAVQAQVTDKIQSYLHSAGKA